jgi:hypothetical protein
MAVVLMTLALFFVKDPFRFFTSGQPEIQNILQTLATVGTFLSALVAFIFGLLRQPAKGPTSELSDSTRDPMRRVSRRFEQVIYSLGERSNSHVAVFIEDLDRCESAYVVELLEGIQTLFRNAPVCYIVAADQRWLLTSFAEVYGPLATSLEENGRPTGYEFIEKAFQLTTSVPPINTEHYLQLLLERRKNQPKGSTRSLTTGTLGDVLLKTLLEVLEKEQVNPRTLNRIVDACIFRQQMSNGKVKTVAAQEQLVLWTLIDVHWPLLAEVLGKYPELLDYAISRDMELISKLVPEHLLGLFYEETVLDVFKRLEKQSILEFSHMYPRGYMQVN